ncbi:hypothetical protein KDW_59640 [Dictyobacter vulcani]|uniref:Clp R domain-containing protein n=1 Tax=Dictyobacter vulcani TaxID=2607529 RepID=A0A5J4KXK0_9CHLR|nr:hypothetical protein KDW_59640 [Dictyobacter vulcani]
MEHLLLGVLAEGSSHEATLLKNCGLDVDTLRAHIDAVYANTPLSREDDPPLSRQAEECVQNAIAMITYYLTRHRPSAKVAPNQLILSIIAHPGNLRLQTAYPIRVATLRQQLIADMEPEFLRHSDKLLLSLRSQPARASQERHTEIHHKHHTSQENAVDKSELTCSACQQPIQAAWKYCAYCGHQPAKICPHCSAPPWPGPDSASSAAINSIKAPTLSHQPGLARHYYNTTNRAD